MVAGLGPGPPGPSPKFGPAVASHTLLILGQDSSVHDSPHIWQGQKSTTSATFPLLTIVSNSTALGQGQKV